MANPPTITHISSERVMLAMYGRTTSGASVWPTKMFAAVDRLSAPLVPNVWTISFAMPRTTSCMMP